MDMIWKGAYPQSEVAIQEEHTPTTVVSSQRFERQKQFEEVQVLQRPRALKIVGKTLEEAINDMSYPETTLNLPCLR